MAAESAREPKILRRTRTSSISVHKVVIYSSAFVALVAVISAGYQTPQQSLQQVSSPSAPSFAAATSNNDSAPSVDEIVATNIAASITERTGLPIASNVASSEISLTTKSELTQIDEKVVSKPQIIQSESSSREIQTHVAKAGDSVEDVAFRYNISENTLKWANDLDSDALEAGRTLTILPVNGVKHKVSTGDTVKSLAKLYKTSEARIISFNDLELSKPKKGQQLIIPNGILPETDRPGYTDPRTSTSISTGMGSSGYPIVRNNMNVTAGNRYAFGNCTSYAYERRAELGRPIGSFWGDGGSWAYSAEAAGFKVDNTPKPGSIQVTYGSPGHVAIVESIAPNGDITLSEMNYGGNFNRVTSRTVSAGQAQGYGYVH